MPVPVLPPPDHTVAELTQHIVATVALAQGLAATGRPVDLSGLDTAVGVLCAQGLDLPPDQGIALRPALVGLQSKLALLAQTLPQTLVRQAP